MHGLTMQYGGYLCNLCTTYMHLLNESVFLVNILRKVQPLLTIYTVVSGGRFVRYALIGAVQEEIDQE
jgi:hypothetical protein